MGTWTLAILRTGTGESVPRTQSAKLVFSQKDGFLGKTCGCRIKGFQELDTLKFVNFVLI